VNPVEFCRDAAAPPGSNFHYATLFHTAGERRDLYALFALRAEILRIVAGTPDAVVAAMRRSWWSDELARVATRQARHPVGMELQRLAERIQLDVPALRYFAAAGGTLPEPADLDRGAPGTAAGIWDAAARACGVSAADAIAAAIRAGTLVDAVENLASGRPAAAGSVSIRPADLGRHLASASRELAGRDAARAEFCRIMTGLSAALCAEMEADGTAIRQSRVSLTPLRKLWIAWRIHRRRPA